MLMIAPRIDLHWSSTQRNNGHLRSIPHWFMSKTTLFKSKITHTNAIQLYYCCRLLILIQGVRDQEHPIL
jgi:hypothetical protein